MTASRLNLTQERALIETLKRIKRNREEIKLLQKMSNKSGVIYYENKSSLDYDILLVVSPVVGAFNRIIEVTTVFTANKQLWPFAVSIPKVYLGSIDDANIVEPVLFDTSLDATLLDQEYELRFIQRYSIDNPASDTNVYVKEFVYSTDKGTFTTGATVTT